MKRNVLREEEYLRILEGILRRDYFPELPALLYESEGGYTLDWFQTTHTTEDDASFAHLLDKANHARGRLYAQRYTNSLHLTTPSLLPTQLSNTLSVEDTSNILIQPQNTRSSGASSEAAVFKKPVKPMYNFIPMTPTSPTHSTHSTSTTSNSSSTLSPAARNLLRSVRKRRHTTSSPFGGATPQRQQHNKK